jgi:3-oxoacyl-[acyl-carrier protein] reductase
VDMRISGRHALVTGASRGLGFAIAAALVAEGAIVTICARDRANVQTAARELGVDGYACDVSNGRDIEELLATLKSQSYAVDILVVNTGGPPTSTFTETDDAMWHSAFDALWLSSVRLIRGCIPGMLRRQWGRIILVTSISAKEPLSNLTLSNAIRPGLHGLVNTLSRELAREGITVNALMPGFTLTERLAQVGFSPEQAAQLPAGRCGRPEELGALAAFLASEQAGYITGQAIACDGGYLRSI